MPPELPESYYLDNVLTLFEHVERVYADILDDEQRGFLASFAALGEDAKRLCVRLLNRSGDCFRVGLLAYAEIVSLDAAIDELAASGLIALDPEIETEILLSLYTKPELLSRLELPAASRRLRRTELDAALLESADAGIPARLRQGERLLQLCCREPWAQCQMLFFGNLNQSMTDFVLRDLGLYQFESYQIDQGHRPYRSQLDIQHHWLLYQLEMLFELCDRGERAQLDAILALMPAEIDADSPAYRKSGRLRYELARQLERLGELDDAFELYRQCPLPPGRERRARILERRGRHHDALQTCLDALADPLDDEEIQFACQFATRLARRHGLGLPAAVSAQLVDHRPELLELELEPQDSVELAVLEHFSAGDGRCYYLENSLFNGVLGLLIWDSVFAALPGAFYNAFQYRPSDFYTPDFCSRRRRLLERTWARIGDNDDIWAIVTARWEQKYGLMNPLVHWQALDLDLIRLALERIDHAHWRAVFARILRDLRNNRSGFPDLVYFPPGGGYELIEVKGPGDTLQKNQRRWMQYFQANGIPHRLARVAWRES